MQEIFSTNNAKVKYLLQLKKKSSLRKKFNEFVIEGRREITLAVKNNYQLISVFYVPEFFSENKLFELLQWTKNKVEILKTNEKVYKKIAYRGSTEGIIALAKMKNHSIVEFKTEPNPLILIAENIEKPGNVGAILRTVDGVGADGLILVNPVVDLYNPNLIRSSIGTVFSVQVAVTNLHDLKKFLNQKQINLYAADLQNSNFYFKENYSIPTAIAVGAEDKGLSSEIRELAKKSIFIPMRGQIDSLNVSVSASILLYEALKQRLNNIITYEKYFFYFTLVIFFM